jgi:hypothetical protein
MGGDRERWTGTTAQWTALRGTSWRPGGAETRGLSRGGACTACGHYPDIVVDEKRDRKRLAHLLTERALMASWCSSGAQTELAFI